MESWAFGADEEALDILTRAGVFDLRECKLCPDGIVVKGEYGISAAIMRAGYNIGTLMAMCAHMRFLPPQSPPMAVSIATKTPLVHA